jgi:uncharacterized protein YcaQ
MAVQTTTIPVASERRLFLGAQGLLDDPGRPAGGRAVHAVVEQLGYLQIETINVVERAHHLILASRLDGYRREHLSALLEKDRTLFEHWTRCASAIPTRWFSHWASRFASARAGIPTNRAWQRYLGDRPDDVVRQVREQIALNGPMRSQDFTTARGPRPGRWLRWKPAKAALECLWASGEVMVTRRDNFQKVYDLTERVLPAHWLGAPPSAGETVDWACRTAVERLVVATPTEIARFWRAIKPDRAKEWCQGAVRDGYLLQVLIEQPGGSRPKRAYALADWERRLTNLPEPPDRIRLLSPFDPVQSRFARLFGFEQHLAELFLPETQRRYGYYVMPILHRDQVIGRLDPRFERTTGTLEILRLDWEPSVKVTPQILRRLEEAATRLARFVGADRVSWPRSLVRAWA